MVSLHGLRVYLDANTVIYALEGYARFTNLKSGLLDPLSAGAFVAVTSEITLVETVVGPRKVGDVSTEAKYRAFLTPTANMAVEPVTTFVLEKVIDLRSRLGFKIPDAIHLATGIISGCDMFVTRDAAWSKAGVDVVDPADMA